MSHQVNGGLTGSGAPALMSSSKGGSVGDLYRAVGDNFSLGNTVAGQVTGGGGTDGALMHHYHQDRKSLPGLPSVSLNRVNSREQFVNSGTNAKNTGGPVLPIDLGRFPLQPFHAVLRGAYSVCFETVVKVLAAQDSGFLIRSFNDVDGVIDCVVEGERDSAFKIALWQLPDGRVLMELMVLASDSNHSWADVFDRLCSHGALRNMVVSRQTTLNSKVSPIGQIVKPVF